MEKNLRGEDRTGKDPRNDDHGLRAETNFHDLVNDQPPSDSPRKDRGDRLTRKQNNLPQIETERARQWKRVRKLHHRGATSTLERFRLKVVATGSRDPDPVEGPCSDRSSEMNATIDIRGIPFGSSQQGGIG